MLVLLQYEGEDNSRYLLRILYRPMSKLMNSTDFPPYCTAHPQLLHICENFALTSIDNIFLLVHGKPPVFKHRVGASLIYEQLAVIAIIIWTSPSTSQQDTGCIVYRGRSRTQWVGAGHRIKDLIPCLGERVDLDPPLEYNNFSSLL